MNGLTLLNDVVEYPFCIRGLHGMAPIHRRRATNLEARCGSLLIMIRGSRRRELVGGVVRQAAFNDDL
jgi:hypothetical protein